MVGVVQGDTFDFSGPVTVVVNGLATDDLTGWTARSQVRGLDDALICDLPLAWLSRHPAVIRLGPILTTDWPIGPALVDVRFAAPDGRVATTTTVSIDVIKGVTQ